MASTPCQKMIFKKPTFFSKNLIFFVDFEPYDIVHISQAWGQNTFQITWRDLRLPMPAFATEARNSFNGKFTA